MLVILSRLIEKPSDDRLGLAHGELLALDLADGVLPTLLAREALTIRDHALIEKSKHEIVLLIARGLDLTLDHDGHSGRLDHGDGVTTAMVRATAGASAIVALGVQAACVTLMILGVRALDLLEHEKPVVIGAAGEVSLVADAVGTAIALDLAEALCLDLLAGGNEEHVVTALAASKTRGI